jgi:hypothetical protein
MMAVLGIVAADAAARRITTRHIRSTNGFAYRQLLLLSEVLLITLQLMQRLKKKVTLSAMHFKSWAGPPLAPLIEFCGGFFQVKWSISLYCGLTRDVYSS